MNYLATELAWAFRARRVQLNLPLRSVAKRAGLTTPQLHRLLTGQHNFTIRTAVRIADALDLDLRLTLTDGSMDLAA